MRQNDNYFLVNFSTSPKMESSLTPLMICLPDNAAATTATPPMVSILLAPLGPKTFAKKSLPCECNKAIKKFCVSSTGGRIAKVFEKISVLFFAHLCLLACLPVCLLVYSKTYCLLLAKYSHSFLICKLTNS